MSCLRGCARKVQGSLPGLLGLGARHGAAVGDALGALRSAPITELPSLASAFITRTRTFTSAAAWEEARQGDGEADEAIEGDGTRLILPTDLTMIARINPELKQVMEAAAAHASGATASARDQLEALLTASSGKRANVNKTNLSALPVNELRAQLEALGADARGTKAVVVQRLLGIVAEEAGEQDVAVAAAGLADGPLSGAQLARRGRLLARRAGGADAGISDAALRLMQEAVMEEAVTFSRVFKDPHEAARLLVEGRAEDVAILDVRGHCTFTDHFVIATGRSQQAVRALASAALHEVKRRCAEVAPGVLPAVEGAADPAAEWLVVDAGSVVVHVFSEAARKEYNLEGLWGREGGANITRVAQRIKAVQTLHSLRP